MGTEYWNLATRKVINIKNAIREAEWLLLLYLIIWFKSHCNWFLGIAWKLLAEPAKEDFK